MHMLLLALALAAEQPQVTTTATMRVVILPMKGSHGQHKAAFEELFAYLERAGLEPTGPPFGRYVNGQPEVPEQELSWEVGFPIGQDATAEPTFACAWRAGLGPGSLAEIEIRGAPLASVRRPLARPRLYTWNEIRHFWGVKTMS